MGYVDQDETLSPLSSPSQCLACYNSALSNPERQLYFAHCHCYLEEYATDSDIICKRDRWWLQCSWVNPEVTSTDSTDFAVLWSNDTVYQRDDFGNFTKLSDTEYLVDDGGICTPLLDLPNRQPSGLWNWEAQKTMRFGLIWICLMSAGWIWPLWISNRHLGIFWKLIGLIFVGWTVMLYLVEVYNPQEALTDGIVCMELSNPTWLTEMLMAFTSVIVLCELVFCYNYLCGSPCTRQLIYPFYNRHDGEDWSGEYLPDSPLQYQKLQDWSRDCSSGEICCTSFYVLSTIGILGTGWTCLLIAVTYINEPSLTFVFAASFTIMILLFLECYAPLSCFVSDYGRMYSNQRCSYSFAQEDIDEIGIAIQAGADSRHEDKTVEMAGKTESGPNVATFDE